MSFLNLVDKTFLVTGVANKKSVAYFSAKTLMDQGARVVLSCLNQETGQKVAKLFPEADIFLCDVESPAQVEQLGKDIASKGYKLSGLLHSMAFANYSEGIKPFHETKLEDYLQASNISCFSLISLTNALKESLVEDASVVTVSISNTRATSYGYMGPIKASLDASVAFLAKSLSEIHPHMRVNAVCAGPLKTSASAGIPGYINNYLFAERLTLRKEALKTQEVANTINFLLSPASSGINATGVVVDAGMSCNYFDQEVVNTVADSI